MKSIRARIILFLVVSLSLINVTSAYYIYQHTHLEIEEIFNAEQAQLARTISSVVSNTQIPDTLDTLVSDVPILEPSSSRALGHAYERKIAYQVWDLEGNLLLMSENAPLYPFAATAPGFSEIYYDDNLWHIFSLYSNESQNWIYTAQHEDARTELLEQITKDQIITMLMVNLCVLVVVVVGVVYGARPIELLSREIIKRGGADLSPIEGVYSKELSPIQKGINSLMEKINDALTQERSFNADLSHELRTPLAAIKVHAQSIELKETLSSDAHNSLCRMVAGIDSMSQTIEQLLLLNRIDAQQGRLIEEEVDLLQLLRETLALLPMSFHQKHDIELSGDDLFLRCNKSLIGTLVRNLVENASKYSQAGTSIIVRLKTVGAFVVIDVVDSGPGMTDEQKANAVKRRYRVSDSQAYGSGLGLSIANKIVALHKGELQFLDKESGTGLVVRVLLPTHPAAAYSISTSSV